MNARDLRVLLNPHATRIILEIGESETGETIHSRPVTNLSGAIENTMIDMDVSANTENGSRLTKLLQLLPELSRSDELATIQRKYGETMREFVPIDGLVTVSIRGLDPGDYKVTRLFKDMRNMPEDVNPWRDWAKIPTHQGGFIGQTIRAPLPRQTRPFFLKDDPVLQSEVAEFGTCLAIPLFDGGEALNWNFFLRRSDRGFGDQEIELLLLLNNIFGHVTKSLVTAREIDRLNQHVSNQIRQIGDLQRSLLPAALPVIDGVEFNVFYQPCEQAGGDYYDFAHMGDDSRSSPQDGDGRWAMMIADVAGHGPSAAVVMAMMQSIIDAYTPPTGHITPGGLLSFLNDQLTRKQMAQSFVTAFCGVYDPREQSLVHACAGHFPPRVKKPGHDAPVVALDSASGIPLGIESGIEYEESFAQLTPGDTLVLYTDGIVESRNPEREMFGLDRLDDAMVRCSGQPACIVPSIVDSLRSHESGLPPADDQTIVVMKLQD